MAITKLLRIKETRGASKSSHLKNNIFYICNPEKTSGGCWIGGNAGTTPDIIYHTMVMNKSYWGKENGTQGFHYVLSFPPELNIDESMAYKITEEFCEELLGDSFYYCIAVHNDKEHMHSHITFDSVSKIDGYKFHSPKGDWERRIQPITDRICEKYGIPTLHYSKDEAQGIDYGSWKDGKAYDEKQKRKNGYQSKRVKKQRNKKDSPYNDTYGKEQDAIEREVKNEQEEGEKKKDNPEAVKYTWYDIIRDDIDEAIEVSDTYEEFLSHLRSQHYEIRDKKYLSLKPFGKRRCVRSLRLGKDYSKDRIKARISERKKGMEFKQYGNSEKLRSMLKKYTAENGAPTTFQKIFYYRYICTANIRHPVFFESWKYKKDVLSLYLYNQQVNYVLHNGIRSREEAEEKCAELQEALRIIRKVKRKLQSSMGPESNFYRMKKLLSLQEEVKKYPEGSRDDLMEQIIELIMKINRSETLDEAYDRYNRINRILTSLSTARKNISDELRLVEGIAGEAGAQYARTQHKKDDDINEKNKVRRITINKKLFSKRTDREDYKVFRIPGTEEYVSVPLKHTMKLSEHTMSAYIYMDNEYDITGENGEKLRTVKGMELMKKYDDRTKKSRKIL